MAAILLPLFVIKKTGIMPLLKKIAWNKTGINKNS
jgi:hypothetical protein